MTQDSHTDTDPNVRWNDAENDSGANDNGLIPTDVGTPDTLYRNNLSQDNTSAASPVVLGDQVDAIAQQYFGDVKVSRTTGIVGMDDPTGVMTGDTTETLDDGTSVDETLINNIIDENNLPIIVTSDSDAPGDTGTLRDAILQANAQPGLNTIEFADGLTGTTGNTIVLQSTLPQITNDLDIDGGGSIYINTNSFQAFQNATTHNVMETNDVASDSGPVMPTTSSDNTPVYLNVTGITFGTEPPVDVNPVSISYGTALANTQLTGTATYMSGGSSVIVPGTFAFTSAAGTVLNAGNGQMEDVTFTPTDTKDFSAASGTVTVNVAKSTPVLGAVKPVSITYGTTLTGGQLSGTATFTVGGSSVTVPGAFTYSTANGALLHPGNGQTESVTFVPSDTADYTSVSSTVTVNVSKAAPAVSLMALNIGFGTELANYQLNGTATSTLGGSSVMVPGAFTFDSASGVLLHTGNGQTEAVTFTPIDTTDYNTVSTTVTINVSSQGTPTVFVNPVNITYGTKLANTQLASNSAIFLLGAQVIDVPGAFTYTSAAGSVLSAGNSQTEAVTFTPTDTASYTTVASTATVNVAQATPIINTVNPLNITYGTALANGQLSGTASFTVGGSSVNVPGAFSFTSAAGGVLSAGNGQMEDVTFMPTDTTDYTTASSTVNVNVAKAMPTVASVNAVNIIYGTTLADSQLSGTVTSTIDGNSVPVPGKFIYTSADGTLLNIGNGQNESVTFTPTDTADYTTASSTVAVNVAPITPTVTVTDAGGIYKGSPFPATGTVTGLAGVNLATPSNPTFLYYLASDTTFAHPLAGAPSDVGNYVAVCLYAATGNYGVGAATTPFAITPAATHTDIASPANPAVYGQQITYTATVTNTSDTAAPPAGSVQFVVDGVNSGTPVPLTAGGTNALGQAISQTVSAPISFLSGASHTVQAVYIPSTNSWAPPTSRPAAAVC